MIFLNLCCLLAQASRVTVKPGGEWGFVPVSAGKDYFYWFYPSAGDPKNDPLVLWESGGPGCSGLFGMIFENGPFSVDDDQVLHANPYSWNSKANVLWIDQPSGAGFSTGKLDTEEGDVADHMVVFLQKWFASHSEYAQHKFFIFGESFGGHYTPALAHALLGAHGVPPLAGIALGNGWVDAIPQYQSYVSVAKKWKVLNDTMIEEYQQMADKCVSMIQAAKTPAQRGAAANFCGGIIAGIMMTAGPSFNPFNFGTPCAPEPWPVCYDFDAVKNWVNNPATQDMLGIVPHRVWETCADNVSQALNTDEVVPYSPYVAEMLQHNVRVLVYVGAGDFVCNVDGSLAWAESMAWASAKEFKNLELHNWWIDKKTVGQAKQTSDGLLTFVTVDGAGHMAPFDKPMETMVMMETWLAGHTF